MTAAQAFDDAPAQQATLSARLLAPIFHRLLDRIDTGLETGGIDARLPDGTRRMLGGRGPGPLPVVTLHRWRALVRLATAGSVGWYEGWTAGDWSSPDPVPLFDLFMRNIAAHYDLGNDFYELWLDPGMTYSSAIFAEPVSEEETLEHAQATKLQAIFDRTATRPGDRILEIGCGWGSFAELAARAGIAVHGLTLSTEQKRQVDDRMTAAGLPNISVALTDYRDVTGTYDAVASIEMVEAVGEAYWPAYLDAIARALKPGGRAAIQYIAIDDAIFDAYSTSVDFIQRYVFPGGMLLSEFVALWRYYLMYCEGGFRGGGIDVAQVTLVKR